MKNFLIKPAFLSLLVPFCISYAATNTSGDQTDHVYIADWGYGNLSTYDSSEVYDCEVTDSSAQCKIASDGYSGAAGIAFNSSGTHAYVTNDYQNSSGFVENDIRNADGTLTTKSQVLFDTAAPYEIALNPSDTIAYVGENFSDKIAQCPIDSSGALGQCIDMPISFSRPGGIVLDTQKRAYVSAFVTVPGNPKKGLKDSHVMGVQQCTVAADGSFIDCFGTQLLPSAGNTWPEGVALNNEKHYLYIASGSSDKHGGIYKCNLNADSGQVMDCNFNDNDSFYVPSGVALNADGTVLYVSNFGDQDLHIPSTLSRCKLDSNGNIQAENCKTFEGGFIAAEAIAVAK